MTHASRYQSIALLGKIASGKGTQAAYILDTFGGALYSNGDRVRSAAADPTPFGLKMKETYENGYLMPEWVASYWMTDTIVKEPTNRIVFEGVAKKPNEAYLFDEIHHWISRSYVVFHLEVPDDVVRARSRERARDVLDAQSNIIERRLEEYHTYTAKSIEFFRTKGTLIDIDGTGSEAVVKQQIFNYLIS
jgi:adenylate kinase